jgi:hypothetical protein
MVAHDQTLHTFHLLDLLDHFHIHALSGGMASSKAFLPVFLGILCPTVAHNSVQEICRLVLLPQFRFTNVLTNETSKTPRTVGTYLRDKEAQRLSSILEIGDLTTSRYLGEVLVELSQTVHGRTIRISQRPQVPWPRKRYN